MELTARWTTIAASQSPWEPDALDYERLLDAEPTRAWSTAVCVSVDDRLNHVDLIVLTVKGYFLVKVKSRAGDVTGDQQRFDWKDEAYQFEFDNRLRLVNLKSKRPNALLASERVLRSARLERASKTLRQAVNSALGTLERMKRVESRDEGRRRLVAEVVYRLPAQPWVQARPSLARDLDDVPPVRIGGRDSARGWQGAAAGRT